MADKEIMKDAELDKVVGGTGMETMGLMNRLQAEGLAKFKTPLIAGNERAAAAELKSFLRRFKDGEGYELFDTSRIFVDSRSNQYGYWIDMHYETLNADQFIAKLRSQLGKD